MMKSLRLALATLFTIAQSSLIQSILKKTPRRKENQHRANQVGNTPTSIPCVVGIRLYDQAKTIRYFEQTHHHHWRWPRRAHRRHTSRQPRLRGHYSRKEQSARRSKCPHSGRSVLPRYRPHFSPPKIHPRRNLRRDWAQTRRLHGLCQARPHDPPDLGRSLARNQQQPRKNGG